MAGKIPARKNSWGKDRAERKPSGEQAWRENDLREKTGGEKTAGEKTSGENTGGEKSSGEKTLVRLDVFYLGIYINVKQGW